MDIPVITLANTTITTITTIITPISAYRGIILLALAAVPVLYIDAMFLLFWAAGERPNKI